MFYSLLHGSDFGFVNVNAISNAQSALLSLKEILGETAAVAVFVAVMGLCGNLARGSLAGAMHVAVFVLAGLLELLVVMNWGFTVAYYASSEHFYENDFSQLGQESAAYKLQGVHAMQVKVQWTQAIFELMVVLAAVARAVSVLARGGGGGGGDGKSAAASKAVGQILSVCFSSHVVCKMLTMPHSPVGSPLAPR